MKTRSTIRAAAMGLCLAAAGARADATDLAVRFTALAPGQNEDWDSAGGAEAQLRFWGDTGLGAALAIGIESWDAKPELLETADAGGYMATRIEGDAAVAPVGLSLLYRSPLGESADLLLEGGLRYAFVESDITAAVYSQDRAGTSYAADPISIDNAFLGVVGVAIEVDFTQAIAGHFGLGYRFDLTDPAETYLGEDIGETSLEAVSGSLGLVVRF